MMQALRSIAEEQGRLTLSQFKRVKQLGSGDVGLVDLVELNARQVRCVKFCSIAGPRMCTSVRAAVRRQSACRCRQSCWEADGAQCQPGRQGCSCALCMSLGGHAVGHHAALMPAACEQSAHMQDRQPSVAPAMLLEHKLQACAQHVGSQPLLPSDVRAD